MFDPLPMRTGRDAKQGSLRIAIGIASAGRRDILAAVLPHIARQTRQPDEIVVCLPSLDDIDSACMAALGPPVRVLISGRGSCRQRNHILDNVPAADIVLFLDDDFLMAPSYLEEAERLFRDHPDIAMCTGTVVADGITGPGISVRDGMRLAEAACPAGPRAGAPFSPVYSAYGCNMAVRMSAIAAGGLRFDENLPLYGWLEDVDFSRLAARCGRIVRASHLFGVHLGTKVGRTPGIRFGYSQIANPIYLVRKQTMSVRHAGFQMGRNLLANLVKVWRPEPWVDRKGRLKGNARACIDLMTGRLTPRNIERLS